MGLKIYAFILMWIIALGTIGLMWLTVALA
jgi:hypothetical protein